jgi:hypothetical protein
MTLLYPRSAALLTQICSCKVSPAPSLLQAVVDCVQRFAMRDKIERGHVIWTTSTSFAGSIIDSGLLSF